MSVIFVNLLNYVVLRRMSEIRVSITEANVSEFKLGD